MLDAAVMSGGEEWGARGSDGEGRAQGEFSGYLWSRESRRRCVYTGLGCLPDCASSATTSVLGVADMIEMIQTCKTRADFLEEVMYEVGFEGPCLGGWYEDTWQGTQEEVPGAGWHWSVGSEKLCPRLGEDRPWQRRGAHWSEHMRM